MSELHPKMQAILDAMEEAGMPDWQEDDWAEAQAYLDAREGAYYSPPVEVGAIAECTIPGPAGPIPVRVYTPLGVAADPPLPVLIYYHGGGWVFGSLESHDPECRALANAAGAVVMSVDYRLAPKHKFPAAAEDCCAAVTWAAASAAEIGGDLAVGPGLAHRDGREAPPDLPLKGRGAQVER